MFDLNPSIKKIDVTKNNIIEIYRSVNDSQVQIPGYESQNSSSFVVSFTKSGEIKIFVFIFLKRDLQGIIYSTDEKIKKNNYVDMRNEAIFFLESMGFMLENMDYRKLPDEEKNKIINSLPPFLDDLSELGEKKNNEDESGEDEDEEDLEVVVEEVEENYDTIPEYSETTVSTAAESKKSSYNPNEIDYDVIKETIENDRSFKMFLLFLSGF